MTYNKDEKNVEPVENQQPEGPKEYYPIGEMKSKAAFFVVAVIIIVLVKYLL